MTLCAGLLTPAIVALAAAGCAPRERPVATVDPIPVLAWAVDELGKSRPYADSPHPSITQFYWLTEGNLTNVDLAVQMTRRQPEGRRVMTDWDVYRRMYRHPADQLKTTAGEAFTAFWWEHGVEDAVRVYGRFFREFKARGGHLDYFVIDTEHGAGAEVNKPERWEAVARDPRFAGILRAVGAASHKEIDGTGRVRPFGYWRYSDYLASRSYARLYDTISNHFPKVRFADYGRAYNRFTDLVSWGRQTIPEGIPGRHGFHIGTHQSPSLYGVVTYLGTMEVEGRKFGLGPYRSLVYAQNVARACRLSSEVPLMPWIAWRGYVSDFEDRPADKRPPVGSFGDTDYFQESVLHTCLLDPDALLMWSAFRWRKDQDPAKYCRAEHLQLVDRLVAQANTLIGYSDRRTRVDRMIPWHAPYVLSGATANGRSVWRLTPDPKLAAQTPASLAVRTSPLTFAIGDRRLVMPGGKILALEPGPSPAPAGCWIVGPPDLTPSEIENPPVP
ncbi:MAG: hypothetical protein KJ579_06250 [Verrucomicrobia bacterium]|nr:hypothetical protein [Verrucomicrobiota bacterium]